MESLRIALEMERRGYQLYKRGLTFAKDPEVHALLSALALEESEHFDYFRKLYIQQELDEAAQQPCTQDLEASLAAEAFFPGGLMQTVMDGGLASVRALLEIAMQAELDSIAFYEKLVNQLPEEHQESLRQIIQQEQIHYAELRQRFEAL